MQMAAIYTRVSSNQQREAHTIASQTAALVEWATTLELEVPQQWIFEDEGYSGATLERPGLEQVRDLAAAGDIQVVLVHSPDRLSRKYAYQVLLTEEFGRHGVETRFLNGPSNATAEDQLLVQFQGMIAEYERAQILERSRRGKRHRARAGEISVLGGAPYGYRYIRKRDDNPAAYVVIEAEARVVRDVYEHYTGSGWSIAAITRWLNEQGVPTRKVGTRWERSTVWGMLRNPTYQGTACFGKTRRARRQRVTRPLRLRGGVASRDSANHERPREEWIEIPVPAIVDESTFARAQELLHENKVHARRRTVEPSLVQGLVSCQKCGYALSRASGRSSARRIHYYRCIGSDGWRHLGGPRCDTRPVRQDLLDEVVWTEVIRLLEEPALNPTGTGSPAGRRPGCRSHEEAYAGSGAGPRASREEHGTAAHRLPGGTAVARATARADAVAASTRADVTRRVERVGRADSRARRPSAPGRDPVGVSHASARGGRDARHRGAATNRAPRRQGSPRQRRHDRDPPLHSGALGATADERWRTEQRHRQRRGLSKLPFAFREYSLPCWPMCTCIASSGRGRSGTWTGA